LALSFIYFPKCFAENNRCV